MGIDHFIREKVVDLGYGHIVPCTRIQLVLNPRKQNVEVQRVLEDAKSRGDLIDLTGRARCRSVLFIEDPGGSKIVLSLKSVRHLSRQISGIE